MLAVPGQEADEGECPTDGWNLYLLQSPPGVEIAHPRLAARKPEPQPWLCQEHAEEQLLAPVFLIGLLS